MSRLFCIAVALSMVSCAAQPQLQREHNEPHPLSVSSARIDLPEAVRALADDSGALLISSEKSTALYRDGAVKATFSTPLRIAAAIPAADGSGQWLVGADASGQLFRVRAGQKLEPIGERYGFGTQPVRAACALSEKRAAFLIGAEELAIADGQSVAHYAVGPAEALACGGSRVALVSAGEVRSFDVTTRKLRTHPLAAVGAVFDPLGRLIVATRRGLYVEDSGGGLALRYLSQTASIRSLTSTPQRIYFAAGSELGTLESDTVSLSQGARLPAAARLVGATGGEVYVLGAGSLLRLSPGGGGVSFAELVAPVFARSCSRCHLPGGRSGVDLSTPQAWSARRSLIRERVLVERSMPPSGAPLSDSDRDAIRRFLEGASPQP